MARSDPGTVYAQIQPMPGLLATGYFVRFVVVMPTSPAATTTLWLDTHWSGIEASAARALRVARDEAAPELPDPLPPCIPIQLEAEGWMVDDPHVDLYRVVRPTFAYVLFTKVSMHERVMSN